VRTRKEKRCGCGGVAHFVTGGGGGGGTYILECAFAQLEALIVSCLGRVRL
jgi:hypothetical protein